MLVKTRKLKEGDGITIDSLGVIYRQTDKGLVLEGLDEYSALLPISGWYVEEYQVQAGVIEIGEFAFWGCIRLRNIILPDKVKEIGFRAFSYCRDLEHLHIPAATEKIDKYICDGSCNAEISIDEGNKFYKVVSNAIIKRNSQTK